MAKLTQGTALYFQKDATTVIKVGRPTAISGISAAREPVETTDLESTARTYEAGIATPGTAQFTLQFDPADTSHKDLHDKYKAGAKLLWALGLSDGTAAPTSVAGSFTLPPARSWITFAGIVTDISFDFSINNVITAQVSVQVSGFPELAPKA